MSDSDLVRVQLNSDYYTGEDFDTRPELWWDRDPQRAQLPSGGLYEVPAEQVARWQAAAEAWGTAQTEIRELVDARGKQRWAERKAQARREEQRRAEIRADLYGGRKKQ